MRVLYITYTGLTENLGQSQILQYLKGLALRGVVFDVISFEPQVNFQERTTALKEELIDLPIHCHFVDRKDGCSTWRRLMAVLAGMKLAIRVARKNQFAAIHCRNAFAAECALAASLFSRVPVLFDMRGFWGEARVETGAWQPDSWKGKLVYWAWKWREATYLRRSALTNCLTEKAKAWIVSKGYKPPEKVFVTPCCVDFAAASKMMDRVAGPEDEGFMCVYVGSRGGVYDDARLYTTFDQVRQVHPSARLLLIGAGTTTEVVCEATRAGIVLDAEVVEVRSMPHEEVFGALARADIGMSFCKPGFYATGVSSTKIGEYLSVGIPVICNEGIGDAARLMAETGGGLALPDLDMTASGELVRNFVKSVGSIDREGVRARAARLLDTSVALENYSQMYALLGAGSE